MKYRILTDDRKKVVREIEALTGLKDRYTGVPKCAYEIGGYTVTKDMMLLTEDEGEEVIRALVNKGLVEGDASDTEETENTASEAESADGIEADEEETLNTASEAEQTEEGQTHISLPLELHTPTSIRNIINTIYAKGQLISKSTGGTFSADDDFVETLNAVKELPDMEDVLEMIRTDGKGKLAGLEFSNGKITFTGFPETDDPEDVKAWTALAAAIGKSCTEKGRILRRRTEADNEKYAFRVWLVNIGMNSPELKNARTLLYKNLSGHVAFRTPADEEKWKARQKEKRDAAKNAEV